MPLFTDGPPSSIEDLAAQDAQLLNVSNVEGIDVTQKLSQAWDELGLELHGLLNQFGAADPTSWRSPRLNLESVVVTPSLKLWHIYRSLEMVYGDAYNCQFNDRYAGKRDYFHERAAWAQDKLREIGIGIASLPVSKAAIAAVNPTAATGPALPDGTYFATTAWVNRNGEEGMTADANSVITTHCTFSVNPGTAPQNATGWNVYAGSDPNAMALQNREPLAIGQIWIQQWPFVSGGRTPGPGQSANLLQAAPRVIQRG